MGEKEEEEGAALLAFGEVTGGDGPSPVTPTDPNSSPFNFSSTRFITLNACAFR
jgi:hypothetical protein